METPIESLEPWQVFVPIANLADPVHFNSDEMSMLLGFGSDPLFNTVMQIDAIHNSLIEAMRVLQIERNSLVQQLSVGDIDGLIATSNLELGQYKKLRAKMNEINDFAENLKSRAERDFVESRDALVAFSGIPSFLGMGEVHPDI